MSTPGAMTTTTPARVELAAAADDAQLLEWTVELPETADLAAVAQSLAQNGYAAASGGPDGPGGGGGAALRTSMSCVGAARCGMSCYDEQRARRTGINSNPDAMHRPALPYKFKFKFSGCPNDCVNSIQRSDLATIGTWRDNIRVDEKLAREWFSAHGMEELVDNVVTRCPTKAIRVRKANGEAPPANVSRVRLDDAQCMEIDNHDCVRCMHCLNVMPGALLPGEQPRLLWVR